MKLCRLCMDSELILDLYDPSIDSLKRKSWIYFVQLSTGVNIREDDIVSKMVCHSCCKIVEKMYKYRVQAIANDKLLKKQAGQMYISPLKEVDEIVSVDQHHLSDTECDMPLVNSCTINQTHHSKVVVNHSKMHSSIKQLIQKYPCIKLPKEVYHCDVAPNVTLDHNEINDWGEKVFQQYQQKLSLVNILIKRVAPKLEDYQVVDHQSLNIIIKGCPSNLLVSKDVPITESSPKNTSSNATYLYKLCSQSKKLQPQSSEATPNVIVVNNISHLMSKQSSHSKPCLAPKQVTKNCITDAIEGGKLDILNTQINQISTTTNESVRITKKRKIELDDITAFKKKYSSSSEKPAPSNTLYPQNPEIDDDTNKKAVFVCHICTIIYDRRKDLRLHQKRHHSCKYCSLRFSSVNHFHIHKSQRCYAQIIKNQPKLELVKVDTIQSIVNRYPDVFHKNNYSLCTEGIDKNRIGVGEHAKVFQETTTSKECVLDNSDNILKKRVLESPIRDIKNFIKSTPFINSTNTGIVTNETIHSSLLAENLKCIPETQNSFFTESELLKMLESPIALDDFPNTTFHPGENVTSSKLVSSEMVNTYKHTPYKIKKSSASLAPSKITIHHMISSSDNLPKDIPSPLENNTQKKISLEGPKLHEHNEETIQENTFLPSEWIQSDFNAKLQTNSSEGVLEKVDQSLTRHVATIPKIVPTPRPYNSQQFNIHFQKQMKEESIKETLLLNSRTQTHNDRIQTKVGDSNIIPHNSADLRVNANQYNVPGRYAKIDIPSSGTNYQATRGLHYFKPTANYTTKPTNRIKNLQNPNSYLENQNTKLNCRPITNQIYNYFTSPQLANPRTNFIAPRSYSYSTSSDHSANQTNQIPEQLHHFQPSLLSTQNTLPCTQPQPIHQSPQAILKSPNASSNSHRLPLNLSSTNIINKSGLVISANTGDRKSPRSTNKGILKVKQFWELL